MRVHTSVLPSNATPICPFSFIVLRPLNRKNICSLYYLFTGYEFWCRSIHRVKDKITQYDSTGRWFIFQSGIRIFCIHMRKGMLIIEFFYIEII